jgi:hypothetical protein
MREGDLPAGTRVRSRVRVWVYRYLPAEVAGTSAALTAALIAASEGVASAVVAATWAEGLAFYTFVTGRELHRDREPWQSPGAIVRALRNVLAEFGVAEAADGILVRPTLMYAFVEPLGGVIPGVIAGKLAADLIFYTLAVPAYELRERGRA